MLFSDRMILVTKTPLLRIPRLKRITLNKEKKSFSKIHQLNNIQNRIIQIVIHNSYLKKQETNSSLSKSKSLVELK